MSVSHKLARSITFDQPERVEPKARVAVDQAPTEGTEQTSKRMRMVWTRSTDPATGAPTLRARWR